MKLVETPNRLTETNRHIEKALQFEKTAITVIQLKKDEVIPEHASAADVLIIVRQGSVSFNLGGEMATVNPQNFLHIEPNELHSLKAEEDSEFLLLQIKH